MPPFGLKNPARPEGWMREQRKIQPSKCLPNGVPPHPLSRENAQLQNSPGWETAVHSEPGSQSGASVERGVPRRKLADAGSVGHVGDAASVAVRHRPPPLNGCTRRNRANPTAFDRRVRPDTLRKRNGIASVVRVADPHGLWSGSTTRTTHSRRVIPLQFLKLAGAISDANVT